jgi:hypothetical protein
MQHERALLPERRSAVVATLRDLVPSGIRVHPTTLRLRRMAGRLVRFVIAVATDAGRIAAGGWWLVFGRRHRVETGVCLAVLRAEAARTVAGETVCCTARVYNRPRDCSMAEFELVLRGATEAASLQVKGHLPLDGRTYHDLEFIISGGECQATMDGRPIAELKQDLRRRRRRCDGCLEATLTVHDPSRRDGRHRLQVLRRLEGPGS